MGVLLRERAHRYTNSGELREIDDSLSGHIRYDYDRAGRMIQANSHNPLLGHGLERFAWDAADNLLQGDAGSTVQGNRLLSWQDS